MTGPTQFNATSTLYAYDNANRLTSLDGNKQTTEGVSVYRIPLQ